MRRCILIKCNYENIKLSPMLNSSPPRCKSIFGSIQSCNRILHSVNAKRKPSMLALSFGWSRKIYNFLGFPFRSTAISFLSEQISVQLFSHEDKGNSKTITPGEFSWNIAVFANSTRTACIHQLKEINWFLFHILQWETTLLIWKIDWVGRYFQIKKIWKSWTRGTCAYIPRFAAEERFGQYTHGRMENRLNSYAYTFRRY